MGSGASTLNEDAPIVHSRELYAPKPEANSNKRKKKSLLSLKVLSLGLVNEDTSTTISQRSNSVDSTVVAIRSSYQLNEDSASISATAKMNAALMTRLVHETIPDFVNYTVEDPTGSDLEMANAARLLLVSPNNYMEFYTTVYENLHDASAKYSFSNHTIIFKNDFLTELMRMVVMEASSKMEYSNLVAKFGHKYSKENIELVEYGLFGEAIILAMRKIQKGLRFDLWPRAYSRFVRALLPAMLIASASMKTVLLNNSVETPEPSDELHIAMLPLSIEESNQSIPPLPGSVEELHLAYAISRKQQLSKPKDSYSTALTIQNTTINANQMGYMSPSRYIPLHKSPSNKKVSFCEESNDQ